MNLNLLTTKPRFNYARNLLVGSRDKLALVDCIWILSEVVPRSSSRRGWSGDALIVAEKPRPWGHGRYKWRIPRLKRSGLVKRQRARLQARLGYPTPATFIHRTRSAEVAVH